MIDISREIAMKKLENFDFLDILFMICWEKNGLLIY